MHWYIEYPLHVKDFNEFIIDAHTHMDTWANIVSYGTYNSTLPLTSITIFEQYMSKYKCQHQKYYLTLIGVGRKAKTTISNFWFRLYRISIDIGKLTHWKKETYKHGETPTVFVVGTYYDYTVVQITKRFNETYIFHQYIYNIITILNIRILD